MIGRSIETFRLRSDLVRASDELRLDASFYNARLIDALDALDRSGEVADRFEQVAGFGLSSCHTQKVRRGCITRRDHE